MCLSVRTETQEIESEVTIPFTRRELVTLVVNFIMWVKGLTQAVLPRYFLPVPVE